MKKNELDDLTKRFLDRWTRLKVNVHADSVNVGPHPIMYRWETPVMEAFAEGLIFNETRLLEIGYGMGIAANCFNVMKPKRHTIIEVHPQIAENAKEWARALDHVEVAVGSWQMIAPNLGEFDAIFLDSVSAEGCFEQDMLGFFKLASDVLLAKGGRMGFFCSGGYLPPIFQTVLYGLFDRLEVRIIRGLNPSEEARRNGFSDVMLCPIAIKDSPRHAEDATE